MKWQRRPGGYMSEDREWFLLRGARMAHGTNAWLIHRRVNGDRIGTEPGSSYWDQRDGAPLWAIDADGYASTERPPYGGPLYAHEYDAGWLSEAKGIVNVTLKREAAG